MALPPRVFCDTSFFHACLDSSDAHHPEAYPLVVAATAARVALWSTWDVVSETITLLRYRVSHASAVTFVDDLYPRLHLVEYGAEVRAQALEVFRRYGRDRRLSFCDAISFIVVTTLLDRMPCFAFDEDFRRLGLTVIAGPSLTGHHEGLPSHSVPQLDGADDPHAAAETQDPSSPSIASGAPTSRCTTGCGPLIAAQDALSVTLSANFRSRPSLIQWLNGRFESILGRDPGGRPFDAATGRVFQQPLEPGRAGDSSPSVHVLPVAFPDSATHRAEAYRALAADRPAVQRQRHPSLGVTAGVTGSRLSPRAASGRWRPRRRRGTAR